MRIEFWLDYLCPIAYLTHKNLIEALKELKIKDYEILYRSFEMIDYCRDDYEIMEVWMDHHHTDMDHVKRLLKNRFPDYKQLKYVSVDKAHQLSHLAKRYDIAEEINTEILRSYFEENKDISDTEVLIEIGEKYNLDKRLIKKVIEKNYFDKQIKLNRENAFLKGIDKIPHMRINIKQNYSGYLSKNEIINILCENCKNNKITYCSSESCSLNEAF